MKSILLKQLMFASKLFLYVFIIQALAIQLVSATGHGQSLSDIHIKVHLEQATLKEAFRLIESKTGFVFGYSSKVAKRNTRYDLIQGTTDLYHFLKDLGRQAGLSFKRIDDKIIVIEAHQPDDNASSIITVDYGVIEGSVTDGATGEPLVGATVMVKGTTIGTVTGIDGSFSLSVPADTSSLVISYVGYIPVEVRLSGNASVIHIKLKVDSQELGEVIVRGIRRSLNKALDIKRSAVNGVDVIVAEDIAKFPQSNLSEALQRVSGVQIRRDYNGGVGNEVSIRGLPPEFTQVTINGIPTPTNGDNRTVNFNILPAEIFGKAEVVKTPTADMDEGGVGGTVRLETVKPLSIEDKLIVASIEGEYNSLAQKLTPKTSLVLGRNFNDKLGVLVSGTYYKFNRGAEAYDAVGWQRTDLDIDGDGSDEYTNVWLMDIPRYISQPQHVERFSINTGVQYKLSETFELDFDGIFNHNIQTADRHVAEFFFRPGMVNNIEDISVNGDVVEFVRDGNLLLDAISETAGNDSKTYQGSLSGIWSPENWEIRLNTAYASVPQDADMFQYFANAYGQTSYDIRENGRYWNVQSAVDINDPDEYDVTQVRRRFWDNNDDEYSARADVKRFFTGLLSSVQAGVKFRDRTKDRSAFYSRVTGLTDPLGPVAISVNGFLDNEEEAPGPNAFTAFDFDKAYEKYGNPIDLTDAELTDSYYHVNEQITSGYLLGTINAGSKNMSFNANLGLRLAGTTITSRGSELNRSTGELTDREVTSNYFDFFPNLSTKLEMFRKLVFRAGFARVLTRPNLGDLAAYRTVDENLKRISAKNPELKPFRANQIDLSLEWYLNSESLISAAYFNKSIESFIATETREVPYNNDIYTLTQPVNGDAASIRGWELNYQQPFSFLPSPFDGLGLVMNYTFSESTYEEELDNGEIFTFGLPNNSRHSYNFIAYYEKYGASFRIAHNFRSKFLREKPNPDLGVKYRDDYGQTDVSAGYDITENLSVSFNVFNMFNSRRYEYIYEENLMDSYFNFGRTYQFGLRYSLK